jgi:succinate dehydrogenase / fumarate reductase, iron-sulfur subunit
VSAPTDTRTRQITFRIFRYTVGEAAGPRFDTYEVDVSPGTTVLTALFLIQQQQDPTLAFRFSCRGAVCGSCAMTINGRCDLACRTQLYPMPTEEVILEPLPNLDVISDLVVDMAPFWDKYLRVRPWLHRLLQVEGQKEIRQSPKQFERIQQFANCILCACCYGACPVLKRQPDYLGPAALAKLWRFMADSRDQRPAEQLEQVDRDDGVWGCDTVYRCIDACPKDVRPTDGIAALRRCLLAYRVRKLLHRGADTQLPPPGAGPQGVAT